MDINSHNSNNFLLYILSLLFGITGLLEIKPLLDFIFISLGIIGLIITIIINIKKLINKE
jgi:hypothetical protein